MLERSNSKALEKQRALEDLLSRPAVAPAQILYDQQPGPGSSTKVPLTEDTFESENAHFEHVLDYLKKEESLEQQRLKEKRMELQKVLNNRQVRAVYMHKKRLEEKEANRLFYL